LPHRNRKKDQCVSAQNCMSWRLKCFCNLFALTPIFVCILDFQRWKYAISLRFVCISVPVMHTYKFIFRLFCDHDVTSMKINCIYVLCQLHIQEPCTCPSTTDWFVVSVLNYDGQTSVYNNETTNGVRFWHL
jgi:hypothetical protein